MYVIHGVAELTARTIGQDPAISLTYDEAGDLSQDGSADGDHQYVWDYRDRLVEVQEKQSGNWNTVAEYKYDARNRRILKVVTNKGGLNGTTRFLWGGRAPAGWQCLEERDGSGDLVARYTYAPGYIDDVAVQERDLNDDDDFADANEVVYYHQNTLFSVYAVTDANESVVERYRYDAYGGVTVLDADGSVDADGLSDVENPYTFTARRLDLETALMHYRFRYYHTDLGRFISRDPVGYRNGWNLYAYLSDRPRWGVDPMGLYAGPALGSMSLEKPARGYRAITIMARYKDPCCDEINFVQLVRKQGAEKWYGDWGKGKDSTPNPPFYLKHGGTGTRSGSSTEYAFMTDEPGGLLIGPAYEFVTCAKCARGENYGKVYGCITWRVNIRADWRVRWFGADAYPDLTWRSMSQEEWEGVLPSLRPSEKLALGLALYGFLNQ